MVKTFKVVLICSTRYADEYKKTVKDLEPNAICQRDTDMVAMADKYPEISRFVEDDENFVVINEENDDWCWAEHFFDMHGECEFTITK